MKKSVHYSYLRTVEAALPQGFAQSREDLA